MIVDAGSSRSLPFPFVNVVLLDESDVIAGDGVVSDVGPGLLELLLLANCQLGIDGRPTTGGGGGVLDTFGPLLSSKALRDLSSCCNSARDCVCVSLFFSIICNKFK